MEGSTPLVICRRDRPSPAFLASQLRYPHKPPPFLRDPLLETRNFFVAGAAALFVQRTTDSIVGRSNSFDEHVSTVIEEIQLVVQRAVQLASPLHKGAHHPYVRGGDGHVKRRSISGRKGKTLPASKMNRHIGAATRPEFLTIP